MTSGAPLRRPDKDTSEIGREDPVQVTKTDGTTVLGEVKATVEVVDGHTNVCVETAGGELVTVGERVELVSGVLAREARKKARGGDSD